MAPTVRLATTDDVDQICAMTARHRRRLADWSPRWWKMADGADAMHRLWLRHLIETDGPVARVVVGAGGSTVGCAVSMPQRDQWFVEDIAVADDEAWPTVARLLRSAVTERPALTCVATADRVRADAFAAAGLTPVSSYWICPTRAEVNAAVPGPLEPGTVLPPAPPHTFGGTFDTTGAGALVFSVEGGIVVGSPSIVAPPVYDSDGTVCIVERIAGLDRGELLATAVARAWDRGDVLVAVVAGQADTELHLLLGNAGFVQTVDVYAWPD